MMMNQYKNILKYLRTIDQQKGFTMIELLLALSLCLLIALLLFSMFANGIHLQKKIRQEVSASDIDRVFAAIARDLENMINFTSSEPEYSAFRGAPRNLTLLLAKDAGFVQVYYSLENAENSAPRFSGEKKSGKRSVLMRSEYSWPGTLLERARRSPVCGATIAGNGLKFSYAAWDPADNRKMIWKDIWEESYFPLLVRVEANFIGDDQSEEKVVRDIPLPVTVKCH